ncbi:MAG: hypothetical protein LBK60_06425 [Verrucomicrobiales bacterium]|jgi:hypothetical protein|nr:hypothetical protein [Verrucomicrobiales bacterium]
MNKQQIANLICEKLQATDSASLELCKKFINLRYEMIWHDGLWKESLVMQTVAVPAHDHSVTLAPEFEFPVAVRCDREQVLPVDQQTLFAVDPDIFDRAGTPSRFVVLPKQDGRARLRLLETPARDCQLLVLGKRVFQPLAADDDTGALVALNNTLIAFAEYDMLERERQYAKAQTKLQEANALMEQMREVERYQTAASAQLIPGPTGTEWDAAEFGY